MSYVDVVDGSRCRASALKLSAHEHSLGVTF
jgi:hypothetical protein